MEIAADPYELKLYQMFQSCDAQRCGLLDEEALRRLCGLLELHDKGAVLIKGLAVAGGEPCVSFERFKEALLHFLGTETDGSATMTTHSKAKMVKDATDCIRESSLVISDNAETYIENQPDCSDREVSPKLVVGSKKYGRRSRPQTNAIDELALSDSDNGEYRDEEHRSCSAFDCGSALVQRSSSQTDITGNRRRATATYNGGGKLKRCSSLPAQKNRQGYERIKPAATNKLKTQKNGPHDSLKPTTPQQQQQALSSSVESLDFINASDSVKCGLQKCCAATRTKELYGSATTIYLSTGADEILHPLTKLCKDTPALADTLPTNAVVDIWERAQVANGRGILMALGFDEDEVNISQLNKVLEEELRSMDEDQQLTLLKASLALQSAEMVTLRQTFRQLHAENAKLRADNKDASQRLAMLAAEIDERHATLEDTSKKEIRLLEQRHAAVVRDLSTRMSNDREHWTNMTSRLEARIKNFEQDELRIKTELDLVRTENAELESEHQKAQKQMTELLEQNIQLNRSIAEMADVLPTEDGHNAESSRANTKHVDEEVLRLVEKVTALQVDNTKLRDKNDELVAEVESLNLELTRARTKQKKVASVMSNSAESEDVVLPEEAEQCANLTATKRRGDSPSKTRITEESPRLGKLRKCANESSAAGENSDTSGEWMALNAELRNSEVKTSCDAHSDEIVALKQNITELEEQLKKLREEITPSTTDERCKELEASLEQMQRAYEDCEDYWQSKLSEERQLFEKERQIYEEEQQESDKKFTELMEKVREYEEQFSKDGRLSPIEERDMLEQQYLDLEAEAEELRENARAIFEEKCKEIERLQIEIEDLRMRLGESVEILTGANEMSNEAAAQRNSATDKQSPASSPINYLWHQQSTIQELANKYNSSTMETLATPPSPSKQATRINLSTSETTIFSTKPTAETIAPIQKPRLAAKPVDSEADAADCEETSSTASGKSYETHSVTSTQSGGGGAGRSPGQLATTTKTTSSHENSSTTSQGIKDELKRLKFFEISLKEQIKDLSFQRDGLVMELQQLQEARPVLEKAYARTAHPSLIQRVNQLELKNRHLQNVIKQQQQYTETLMQQSWRQHQLELSDLHGRIETQGSMLAEQSQRLQNADILVKDLYVENSHLAATVQQLEQHRARAHLQMHQQRQGLSGLPGMP